MPPEVQPDMEMVAVRFNALFDNLARCCEAMAACCARVPQLVEISIPYLAHPFRFTGEMRQETTQNTMAVVFSVPEGMTGVITGFSVREKMPGMMAGTKMHLLVNGMFQPAMPRVEQNVGSDEKAYAVRIFLQENDEVEVYLDCPWVPITLTSAAEIEYGISFSIEGYYLDKELFGSGKDNQEV